MGGAIHRFGDAAVLALARGRRECTHGAEAVLSGSWGVHWVIKDSDLVENRGNSCACVGPLVVLAVHPTVLHAADVRIFLLNSRLEHHLRKRRPLGWSYSTLPFRDDGVALCYQANR